jgi:hypothetical protein
MLRHLFDPRPLSFRSWHSASVLSGLVYIVGGGDTHCEVLRFDPASDAWSNLTPTPVSREDCGSFVVGECLYVAGGDNESASVERYDVASNTWTASADMFECRRLFGAVTIGSAGPAKQQNLFDSLIVQASSGHT